MRRAAGLGPADRHGDAVCDALAAAGARRLGLKREEAVLDEPGDSDEVAGDEAERVEEEDAWVGGFGKESWGRIRGGCAERRGCTARPWWRGAKGEKRREKACAPAMSLMSSGGATPAAATAAAAAAAWAMHCCRACGRATKPPDADRPLIAQASRENLTPSHPLNAQALLHVFPTHSRQTTHGRSRTNSSSPPESRSPSSQRGGSRHQSCQSRSGPWAPWTPPG